MHGYSTHTGLPRWARQGQCFAFQPGVHLKLGVNFIFQILPAGKKSRERPPTAGEGAEHCSRSGCAKLLPQAGRTVSTCLPLKDHGNLFPTLTGGEEYCTISFTAESVHCQQFFTLFLHLCWVWCYRLSHAFNFCMRIIPHLKYPACPLPKFHFLWESSCKIQVATFWFAVLNHDKNLQLSSGTTFWNFTAWCIFWCRCDRLAAHTLHIKTSLQKKKKKIIFVMFENQWW